MVLVCFACFAARPSFLVPKQGRLLGRNSMLPRVDWRSMRQPPPGVSQSARLRFRSSCSMLGDGRVADVEFSHLYPLGFVISFCAFHAGVCLLSCLMRAGSYFPCSTCIWERPAHDRVSALVLLMPGCCFWSSTWHAYDNDSSAG